MKNKGLLLVLATAIISGFSIFINQFGVKMGSAEVFTFTKNLIVGLVIVALLLVIKEFKQIKELKKKDWLTLALIGIIGGAIPFLLFYKGLAFSMAANASFIHKSMFLPVALLALIFLKEKINFKLLTGILFLMIGNVLLLKFSFKNPWGTGELLIMAATLFWAVENIVSKKAVASISPKIVAAARMLFGSGLMLVYFIFSGQLSLIGQMNLAQFWWVLITAGILLLYQLTWYTGLKYTPVSVATCILALGSPITTLLSVFNGKALVIGDYFSLLFFALACLIVIISVRQPKIDQSYESR